MATLEIDAHQHCTYPNQDGEDDYSFSHTAAYCNKPQPRRCGCAFCYPEGPEETLKDALRRALQGASGVYTSDDFDDAIDALVEVLAERGVDS